MNKKGQVVIYVFMIAIVILVLAIGFAPGVKDSVDTARGTSGMNCTSSNLDVFGQLNCVSTDMFLFYFIFGLIAIAGIVILRGRV